MCHANDRFGSGAHPLEQTTFTASDGHVLPVTLAKPSDPPKGIVLLVLDAFGMSPFYGDVAGELAGRGFATVVPDFFSRLSPLADTSAESRRARRRAEMDDERVVRDFDELAPWAAQACGAELPMAVVGFCLGGMFALTIAARTRRIDAGVTFYGYTEGQPGRSLVDVPAPASEAAAMDLPLLLHWGTADHGAYEKSTAEKFAAAVAEAGGSAQVATYEDATHAFLKAINDEESPNSRAARGAWTSSLAFLDQVTERGRTQRRAE